MKVYIALLLLMASISMAVAQSGESKGYVVLTSGDTIRGMVNFNEESFDKAAVVVRNPIANTRTAYPRNRVTTIYLESSKQFFVVRNVQLDVKPVANEELEADDPEPKLQAKTVFLMVVASGQATLYLTKDSRTHFFLEKQGQGLEELLQYKYRSLASSKVVTVNKYVDQLRDKLADCSTLEVGKPSYTINDLLNVVSGYNKCKGAVSSYSYDFKQDSSKLTFFVQAGVAGTLVDFTGTNFGYNSLVATTVKFKLAPGPVIAAGFEFRSLGSKGRLRPSVTALYRSNNSNGVGNITFFRTDAQLAFHYIRLQAGLSIATSEKRYPLLITAGVSTGYGIEFKNTMTIVKTTTQEVMSTTRIRDFNSIDVGAFAGFGYRKDRLRYDFKVETAIIKAKEADKVYDSSLIVTGLSLTASYFFSR